MARGTRCLEGWRESQDASPQPFKTPAQVGLKKSPDVLLILGPLAAST